MNYIVKFVISLRLVKRWIMKECQNSHSENETNTESRKTTENMDWCRWKESEDGGNKKFACSGQRPEAMENRIGSQGPPQTEVPEDKQEEEENNISKACQWTTNESS